MPARTRRLLVIDDEVSVRSFFVRALEGAGHEVRAADSIASASATLRENGEFDVYLIDVLLPDGNGRIPPDAIRQQQPHALIIFVTGLFNSGLEVVASGQPHVGFLQKPVAIRELREAVELMLLRGTTRSPHVAEGPGAETDDPVAAAIERRRSRRPDRRRGTTESGTDEHRLICQYCFQLGDHRSRADCLRALERAC